MRRYPYFLSSILGLVMVLAYFFGIIWPEPFWGIHAIDFLPTFLKCVFLGCGLALAFLPFFNEKWVNKLIDIFPKVGHSTILFWGIAIGMWLLFYHFPIKLDAYGDSAFNRPQIDGIASEWTAKLSKHLFLIDPFEPKTGEHSFFAIIYALSWLFSINGIVIWRILVSLLGGLFVFLWLKFVSKYIQHPVWWWVMVLIGLTAPFLQLFFGHIEVYALSITSLLGYFMALVCFFEKKEKSYLYLSLFLFLVCLKFHITTYFLFPSIILAIIYAYIPRLHFVFNMKNMAAYILLPLVLAGLFIYFFITESHFGTRTYTETELNRALFLPISAKEGPPLDRYNLLSFNHIFDYVNMTFLWSAAALFLLISCLFVFRKKINWNKPSLVVTGLSLIIYAGGFFVINPLLSMPIDWDLFSLPAPLLLVFTLLLIEQLQKEDVAKYLVSACIGLCLLSIPFFIVNGQIHLLSHRLESIGKHQFKTYWLGASTSINLGIRSSQNEEIYESRRLKMLDELEPYVVVGKDLQYSALLCETGQFFLHNKKEFEKALFYLEKANQIDPSLEKLPYHLVLAHFYSNQYPKAYHYLNRLVAFKYPNEQKATRMAIHISIEANEYLSAQQYCKMYLEKWPEDEFILKVSIALQKGENLDQIKLMFSQK